MRSSLQPQQELPPQTKSEHMKKNHSSAKSAGETRTRPVHIEFNHSTASRIGIAGTFNDWRPAATLMVPLGDGRWLKDLVLAPGVYEYRLVVDGEWMPDPHASETAPNPFGGINSVLKVNGCAS
jgi:hypothetical protein